MLKEITPLILTYNEEANITRCLRKLTWAKRVVVVDSYSTDGTISAIKKFPNAQIFQRSFDGFATQTNWGLSHIDTEWVLSLDADYVLTDGLVEAISNISNSFDGYFAPFKYCMDGKPLRSTLLPPREILFRKNRAVYIQDGHAHKLVNSGCSGTLTDSIYHDDRKSFSRWWQAQKKYADQEAQKLRQTPYQELLLQDKLRKWVFIAPLVVFFYCLFWRGLILDGGWGLIYSFQRFLAEGLLSVALLRKR